MTISEAMAKELRSVASDVVGRHVTATISTAGQTTNMIDELAEALTNLAQYVADEPTAGTPPDEIQRRLESLVDDFAEAIGAICDVQARKTTTSDLLLKRRRELHATPAVDQITRGQSEAQLAQQLHRQADRITDPQHAAALRRMAAGLEATRRTS